MEVYYERLLKLVNNLQTPITNKFLTTIFRSKLQLEICYHNYKYEKGYTHQHKKLALLCEEIFSKLETQSFYLGTLGIKHRNGLQLHIKL
jgi:hypothetical protein